MSKVAVIDLDRLEKAIGHRFDCSPTWSAKMQNTIMDSVIEFLNEFIIDIRDSNNTSGVTHS